MAGGLGSVRRRCSPFWGETGGQARDLERKARLGRNQYWLRPPKTMVSLSLSRKQRVSNCFLFGQSRLLVVVDFLTVDHYAK